MFSKEDRKRQPWPLSYLAPLCFLEEYPKGYPHPPGSLKLPEQAWRTAREAWGKKPIPYQI